MLVEGSSVKESPEDNQATAPFYIKGGGKISHGVSLFCYTSVRVW